MSSSASVRACDKKVTVDCPLQPCKKFEVFAPREGTVPFFVTGSSFPKGGAAEGVVEMSTELSRASSPWVNRVVSGVPRWEGRQRQKQPRPNRLPLRVESLEDRL